MNLSFMVLFTRFICVNLCHILECSAVQGAQENINIVAIGPDAKLRDDVSCVRGHGGCVSPQSRARRSRAWRATVGNDEIRKLGVHSLCPVLDARPR